MAKPTEFKHRELAMYASNHLLRNADGTLVTGTEPFRDQDDNERQATVVYGIRKRGEVEELVPLEEVTLQIFLRNDLEGGPKKEAYPALRYGRNPSTRRNGPMEQRYLAEDLIKFEQEWVPVKHERAGKETTYLVGRGTVSPLNSKNLSEGFMVDYDSIEPPEIPFDVAAHFENTAVAKEQYWAAKDAERAAQAAAAAMSTPDTTDIPDLPDMETPGMDDDQFDATA